MARCRASAVLQLGRHLISSLQYGAPKTLYSVQRRKKSTSSVVKKVLTFVKKSGHVRFLFCLEQHSTQLLNLNSLSISDIYTPVLSADHCTPLTKNCQYQFQFRLHTFTGAMGRIGDDSERRDGNMRAPTGGVLCERSLGTMFRAFGATRATTAMEQSP